MEAPMRAAHTVDEDDPAFLDGGDGGERAWFSAKRHDVAVLELRESARHHNRICPREVEHLHVRRELDLRAAWRAGNVLIVEKSMPIA
eukprot:6186615-Pleurochrysis_carterae.AAC.2